ncbi:MAG: hypothetical protein Q7T63_20990 [Burkholderiaceae bacterium]|nr:hypothetical protein [Burkholderiaceae bacterium]MDO9089167.1 hypothetical protein [Burkholderiaceae bacterium]
MPLRIYLDSSDYSVLSDPDRAAREAPGVLEALQRLRDAGLVEFFFSAAHLTEMAPVQPAYTDAALRRSSMLAALCGGNCLVHHETLFRAEVSAALGLSSGAIDPSDRNGKWFPEGATEMSPVTEADHLRSIRSTIADVLPNATRAQRRRVQRKVTKGGKLRPALRCALGRGAEEGDLSEILAIYPMRPDAARVLARYIAGGATAAEATAAFESSLRDPRWMMQWFEKHHDKLTPFISWARGPAAQLTDRVRELARHVEHARANPMITEERRVSTYGPAKWEELQANMLVGIAHRFGEGLKSSAKLDIALVDKDCPGISTAIRSLHSAWHSITFENPRTPKDSDFVDALHAAYAPYVDVFRTDGFMANHVAKQVARFGTTVVPKLSSLPEALRQRGVVASP